MEKYLHTNFAVMLAGLVFWFILVWSQGRSKDKWDGWESFKKDQKDEMIVALFGGLMFVIWDDQVLNAVSTMLFYAGKMFSVKGFEALQEEPIRMQQYQYFLVGPTIEVFYWFKKKLTA